MGVRIDRGLKLMRAIESSDAQMVRLVLNGAPEGLVNKEDSNGRTPLMSAARVGAAEVAKVLLDAGADASLMDSSSGRCALTLAAGCGGDDVVSCLIGSGFDVDFLDNARETALMVAARGSMVGVMDLLIAGGADVNGKSSFGWTPLMYVARFGSLEALDLLLSRGEDANMANAAGETALALAAGRPWSGASGVVRLLESGASINWQDAEGSTALHQAVKRGRVREVQDLIMAGADIFLADAVGKTADDVASHDGIRSVLNAAKAAKDEIAMMVAVKNAVWTPRSPTKGI